MRVAILGAGAGGLSAAVALTLAGHAVRLWNRHERTLAPHRRRGGICYEGVLGRGLLSVECVSCDLERTIAGVDSIVVCLPALVHEQLFEDLVRIRCTTPIVLNPGPTGGALHARSLFTRHGLRLPPLVEFSTLTYIARVVDGVVHTTGRAGAVRVGMLPHGEPAMQHAMDLFPEVVPVPDVLAASLSNVNLVLHPPGAILAAAWVEATGGEFRFYVDAMTEGVGRVVRLLDAERLTVAAAFGHDLPPLVNEMAAIGSVPAAAAAGCADVSAAIRAGEANARIMAPDSFAHRYYQEDFGFGLTPLRAFADIAGVAVPTASALLALGNAVTGTDLSACGRNAERLGIAGLDAAGLVEVVTAAGATP